MPADNWHLGDNARVWSSLRLLWFMRAALSDAPLQYVSCLCLRLQITDIFQTLNHDSSVKMDQVFFLFLAAKNLGAGCSLVGLAVIRRAGGFQRAYV